MYSVPTDSAASKDPNSHHNEGFLKSLWHKVTDHPAHRDDATKTDGQNNDKQGKKDEKNGSK